MYKKNDIVNGIVIFINKTYFLIELKNGWQGICYITDISDYFISDIKNIVNNGEEISLKIIKVNNKNKQIKLSYKIIMPRFQKDPFSYDIKETTEGFKNLKSITLRRLEND